MNENRFPNRDLYGFIFLLVCGLSCPFDVLAQASVRPIYIEVSDSYKVFIRLSYGVSAIMAAIGGIKVYSKISNGESDFQRSLIVWGSACAISLAAPLLLDALFGTSGSIHDSLETANRTYRRNYSFTLRIMSVLMAFLGVIGAVSVYRKWSVGDPDTYRVSLSWFGGLVFYGVVLKVLDSGIFGTFP